MKSPIKILILFLFLIQLSDQSVAVDTLTVSSPDKKITVIIRCQDKLSYSIKYQDELILQPSYIDLTLDNGKSLSDDLSIHEKHVQVFNDAILSPVPEKRKRIADN